MQVKKVNLVNDLKTGDMIYLDDKTIIRYSDENMKLSDLKKIETSITRVKRQGIDFILRSSKAMRKDNKYKSGLKFNPEFKQMCREQEILNR